MSGCIGFAIPAWSLDVGHHSPDHLTGDRLADALGPVLENLISERNRGLDPAVALWIHERLAAGTLESRSESCVRTLEPTVGSGRDQFAESIVTGSREGAPERPRCGRYWRRLRAGGPEVLPPATAGIEVLSKKMDSSQLASCPGVQIK